MTTGDETSSKRGWGRAIPLTALRAFEATGRHESLRKAADELGVTPSAISHRIKYLERYLGRSLIDRRRRSITLTSIGQALMTDLTEGFSRLNGAMRWLMETRGNSVKISSAPTVAVRWLIPRLGRFRALHPEIDVQISITGELVDFFNDDIDIAIRYGMGRYPRLMSDKLFSSEAIVVCVPSLLKNETLPLSPARLARYPLLEDSDTANAAGHPGWPMVHRFRDRSRRHVALSIQLHASGDRRGALGTWDRARGSIDGPGRVAKRAPHLSHGPQPDDENGLLPSVSADRIADSGGIRFPAMGIEGSSVRAARHGRRETRTQSSPDDARSRAPYRMTLEVGSGRPAGGAAARLPCPWALRVLGTCRAIKVSMLR